MKYFNLIILTFLLLTSNLFSSSITQNQSSRPINQDQCTLLESLTNLSNSYNIKIDLKGNIKSIPKTKFNLNLKQATFEQAIKEALKIGNVQSYAVFFNQAKNCAEIWILGTSKKNLPKQVESSSNLPRFIIEDDSEPLTQKQIDLLAQNNQEFFEKDYIPMTKNQLNRLRVKNSEIEAERKESMKPLTQEQLNKLREKSAEIEAERKESMKPLTQEQLNKLREKSAEIEAEIKETINPLTQGQKEKLRKFSDYYNKKQIN